MAPKVAIVICNWNKKDYVMQCITAAKSMNYPNFDIIVVDNASTDDSVENIQKWHSDVVLLINEINLGGSGGFNTGMRYALNKKEYKYIYLLDNDAVVDKDALLWLVNSLEKNPEAAIAGSKIYMMDEPNRIMELGAFIDWENFDFIPNKRGVIESGPCEENIECDYVAACSLLARVSALEKFGIMDDSYFLYWDDIEWSQRLKKHGYSILAVGKSRVWHKFWGINTTTLPAYYFWRNRYHFYNQYLPDNDWKRLMSSHFTYFFRALFLCSYYNKKQSLRTIYEAIKDFLNEKRGQVNTDQIGAITNANRYTIEEIADNNKQIYILQDTLSDRLVMLLTRKYPDHTFITTNDENSTPLLRPCYHILDANYKKDATYRDYYIDSFLNILPSDGKGANVIAHYHRKLNEFTVNYLPMMLEKARRIREEYRSL